jgi:hypothetical protein
MSDNANKKKRFPIIPNLIILVALLLVSLLVWQGTKQPDMSKTQSPSVLIEATETTSAGYDLFLRTGGGDFSVSIPACALEQEERVILTPLGQYTGGQDSTEVMRPRAVEISLIDPDDQVIENGDLLCPLQVCFILTGEMWTHYLSAPGDFEIQYLDYDVSPAAWISLPVYENSENREVCASYNHLGLFSLALQPRAKPTEMPFTGLYEPPGN